MCSHQHFVLYRNFKKSKRLLSLKCIIRSNSAFAG